MEALEKFLLARIAEDEAVAQEAAAYVGTARWRGDGPAGTHQGRHDPARVIAECEARRRLIEAAHEANGMESQIDGEWGVGPRDFDQHPYLGDVILRALAAPYGDHPDYRAALEDTCESA